MAKMKWLKKVGLLSCSLFFTHLVTAQEQSETVKYYEDTNITNQIPYFDNRFKIDAELEEITLIFYRVSGTPPIILVRPDGSKLRINNIPRDRMEWYDDRTYDMIKIKNPMPGPWQAIGSILPKSKIMVVSDVSLKVEPLPEILLAGETLKVTASVLNQEKAINDPLFNDVINLDIDFYSTNNSNFDNFGSEPEQIGSFRDDGYDLDEYARDGVFTGEFTLDFAPGEWIPIYYVKMPMASRELRQQPVVIQPIPVELSVETTTEELEKHKLVLSLDKKNVDVDSMVFQGRITYPDRQTQPFSIMEGKGDSRVKEFGYTEPGVHRINLNGFGKTTNGREFRLVVPEFTFNVDRKDGLLVPTLENSDSSVTPTNDPAAIAKRVQAEAALEKARLEQELEDAKQAQLDEAEASKIKTYITIGVINAIIILFAGGLYLFLRFKRKKAQKK